MSPKLKEAVRGFLPGRLKAHRIRRGPLMGHRIYTSWHDYPGAIRGNTEAALLAWFARNVGPGQTWLDVGAHYGYTAMALSNLVGAAGRVFAFEPVPASAGCIGRTREMNRLHQLQIVPLGLSSDPGLHPHRLPAYRGMVDSTLSGAAWTEVIFATSLDHVWDSLCDQNPVIDGIKIDVQGMEGGVLAGMAAVLRRWHPKLVVEFHAGADRAAILDLVTDCGYRRDAEAIDPAMQGNLIDDASYAFASNATSE